MLITISPTQTAEWIPGTRTINLYDTRTMWEFDCISFGYDKPDQSTTQLDMMDALLRRLLDYAMHRHPAARNTVLQDECDHGYNDGGPCPTCDMCGHTQCEELGAWDGDIGRHVWCPHFCRPGDHSDAICGVCKAPLT